VNLLAIETATTACAVAIRTSSGDERALVVEGERHHTEALAPGIRELLLAVDLPARELERVVVDRGPGLFTGLRVGVATAIGFALAAGAELVGVTSLEVLARGAHASGVRGTLLAAVDGRRGELFVQTFLLEDEARSVDEPIVTTPSQTVTEWSRRGGAVTFTGDGVARYATLFRGVAGGSLYEQRVPPVLEALRLGAERDPDSAIVPLYLREADAVANFATRDVRP